MRHLLSLVGFCVVAGGCAKSAGEDACKDFVDTFVSKVSDDCGLLSASAAREMVHAGLEAGGIDGCGDVDRLRDSDTFYGECLPAIEAIACDEIATLSTLPESCENQLLIVAGD